MNRSTVRLAQLFVFGFCLVTLPLLAQDSRLPGDCKSIAAWVERNAADLPRTYEELDEFPMAYRRAIFSALSNEEKSELWRSHLQKQLEAGEVTLTPEQRQLIERAMELTGPELFEGRRERVTRLRIAAFDKAIRGQFDHATTRKIFGQVGGEGEVIKVIVKKPACSCSSVSDYCPDGHGCDETAGCNVVKDACGTFWMYDCDGLCVDPSNTN